MSRLEMARIRDPRQYGSDLSLCTGAEVCDLIVKKLGIRLGRSAAGELMAKLGQPPQRPLQRVCRRKREFIENGSAKSFFETPSVAYMVEC